VIGGFAPNPPRFIALVPKWLDVQGRLSPPPGTSAPESALELRLRRALPSAQVSPAYAVKVKGCL
jgi:hypothetical protein